MTEDEINSMALAPPSVGDYRRMEKALTEAIARAEVAEAALARASEPCVWKARKRERGGGTMIEPTCERAAGDWGFVSAMESMPTRFCPNCGHPIEVQP